MTTTTRYSLVALAATLVALVGIACSAPPPRPEAAPAPPDPGAELKPVVDTFIEVWNSKDYDKLDGILSADFKRTAPDQNADGVAAMKEFMGQVHATYPDFHIVIDESAYKEGVAFIHWTVTGTNTGEGGTGKSVTAPGITLLRFAQGKIAHEIVAYDTAALMAQLGVSQVPHATE